MFHTSSQRKYWVFNSAAEVQELREGVNNEYKSHYNETFPNKKDVDFLSVEEEQKIVEYYELVIMEVSGKFQPPLPRAVTACAITYLKRFYLKTSVMDHPPKEMFLVCLYMACKVEEHNLSVEHFVQILPSDRREKVMDFILAHELLLMERLDFHLTIHHPLRPMEGFLIDIKTHSSTNGCNPEKWRSKAEDFLRRALRTDVAFYYSPSQIALAALVIACSSGEVQKYISDKFDSKKTSTLLEKINSIADVVNSKTINVTKEQVKGLELKLKACRNPENNPDGKLFKRKKTDKATEAVPEKKACPEST